MIKIEYYEVAQVEWREGICNSTERTCTNIANFSTKEKAENYLKNHKELFYERCYGYEGSKGIIRKKLLIIDEIEE